MLTFDRERVAQAWAKHHEAPVQEAFADFLVVGQDDSLERVPYVVQVDGTVGFGAPEAATIEYVEDTDLTPEERVDLAVGETGLGATLVALSIQSRVRAYVRRSKSGKAVRVKSYYRLLDAKDLKPNQTVLDRHDRKRVVDSVSGGVVRFKGGGTGIGQFSVVEPNYVSHPKRGEVVKDIKPANNPQRLGPDGRNVRDLTDFQLSMGTYVYELNRGKDPDAMKREYVAKLSPAQRKKFLRLLEEKFEPTSDDTAMQHLLRQTITATGHTVFPRTATGEPKPPVTQAHRAHAQGVLANEVGALGPKPGRITRKPSRITQMLEAAKKELTEGGGTAGETYTLTNPITGRRWDAEGYPKGTKARHTPNGVELDAASDTKMAERVIDESRQRGKGSLLSNPADRRANRFAYQEELRRAADAEDVRDTVILDLPGEPVVDVDEGGLDGKRIRTKSRVPQPDDEYESDDEYPSSAWVAPEQKADDLAKWDTQDLVDEFNKGAGSTVIKREITDELGMRGIYLLAQRGGTYKAVLREGGPWKKPSPTDDLWDSPRTFKGRTWNELEGVNAAEAAGPTAEGEALMKRREARADAALKRTSESPFAAPATDLRKANVHQRVGEARRIVRDNANSPDREDREWDGFSLGNPAPSAVEMQSLRDSDVDWLIADGRPAVAVAAAKEKARRAAAMFEKMTDAQLRSFTDEYTMRDVAEDVIDLDWFMAMQAEATRRARKGDVGLSAPPMYTWEPGDEE